MKQRIRDDMTGEEASNRVHDIKQENLIVKEKVYIMQTTELNSRFIELEDTLRFPFGADNFRQSKQLLTTS